MANSTKLKRQILSNIGAGICVVVSLLGLIWELAIIKALLGFWIAIIAFILFPATLALVPWYMMFAYGNFQLFAFVYGGFLIGGFLIRASEATDEKKAEEVKPMSGIKAAIIRPIKGLCDGWTPLYHILIIHRTGEYGTVYTVKEWIEMITPEKINVKASVFGNDEFNEELLEDVDAVLLLNCIMPKPDGLEILERIYVTRPELPVVVSSGTNDEQMVDRITGFSNVVFKHKPDGVRGLVHEVNKILFPEKEQIFQ